MLFNLYYQYRTDENIMESPAHVHLILSRREQYYNKKVTCVYINIIVITCNEYNY